MITARGSIVFLSFGTALVTGLFFTSPTHNKERTRPAAVRPQHNRLPAHPKNEVNFLGEEPAETEGIIIPDKNWVAERKAQTM
jgi:hypothetical protein